MLQIAFNLVSPQWRIIVFSVAKVYTLKNELDLIGAGHKDGCNHPWCQSIDFPESLQ